MPWDLRDPRHDRYVTKPSAGTGPKADIAQLAEVRQQLEDHGGLDVNALLLAFWIDLLSRLATSWRLVVSRTAGLEPTEAHILLVLRISVSRDEHTPTWLRRVMRLTSGGISRAADRLIASGLLIQVPSATDRRSVTLELTEQGSAAADQLLTLMSHEQSRRLAHIPQRRQEELLAALAELAACFADAPVPA